MKLTKQRLKEIIKEELAEASTRTTAAQVDRDRQIGTLVLTVKRIVNNPNVTEEIILKLEQWAQSSIAAIDTDASSARDAEYNERWPDPFDPDSPEYAERQRADLSEGRNIVK